MEIGKEQNSNLKGTSGFGMELPWGRVTIKW
jgi:hypothetical protein